MFTYPVQRQMLEHGGNQVSPVSPLLKLLAATWQRLGLRSSRARLCPRSNVVQSTTHESSIPAAREIALTMFTYPVQRQMLPWIALRISASLGAGLCSSRYLAAISIPGVQ
jgi:hypothetical protein